MKQLTGLLHYAKAHIALVGTLLTWYVATYLSGQYANDAAIALAVLTALGVLAVPNKKKPKGKHAKGQPAHTVVRRHIPVTEVVPGRPLGRHVNHDSRSLDYLVPKSKTRKVGSYLWQHFLAVLNQLNVGACTGNAATGALGTAPDWSTLAAKIQASLNESFALNLYSAAEKIDGGAGYPPEDNGSSGLSVAKACKAAGLISSYLHITSVSAALTAISTGPFIIGSNWYTGMDSPDSTGLVTATGTVRGGHEYLCIGYDAAADLWHLVNSWGDTYGILGHFYYSSATFKALLSQRGDATVLLPLAPPAPPAPNPPPADPVDAALAAIFHRVLALKSEPSYLINEIKTWLAAKGL